MCFSLLNICCHLCDGVMYEIMNEYWYLWFLAPRFGMHDNRFKGGNKNRVVHNAHVSLEVKILNKCGKKCRWKKAKRLWWRITQRMRKRSIWGRMMVVIKGEGHKLFRDLFIINHTLMYCIQSLIVPHECFLIVLCYVLIWFPSHYVASQLKLCWWNTCYRLSFVFGSNQWMHEYFRDVCSYTIYYRLCLQNF